MNPITTHYLNVFLGGGAIALQIVSVAALFILFFINKNNKFLAYIEKHFLVLGFLISLFASVFSLIYSEIINFAPCYLCWYQRVFMFPQVFLFGVALWEKNKKVLMYSWPILCVGFIISVYQNFGYYFGESNAPCDASGVSCYQRLISEFGGYISIPMLSLTAFFAMLTLCLVVHFRSKTAK